MTVQTLNKSREPRTKSAPSVEEVVSTKADSDDAVARRVLAYLLRQSFIYEFRSPGDAVRLRCFDIAAQDIVAELSTSGYVRTSHPQYKKEERLQIALRAMKSLIRSGLVTPYRGPAWVDTGPDSNRGVRLSNAALVMLMETGAWADRPGADAAPCVRRAWARNTADILL